MIVLIILMVLVAVCVGFVCFEHSDGTLAVLAWVSFLLGLVFLAELQTQTIKKHTEQLNITDGFYETVQEYDEDVGINEFKVSMYYADALGVAPDEALEKLYDIPADKADAIVNLYFE